MTSPGSRVFGAVLCGGASSRMGSDKSLLGPEGRPLAAQVASAIQDAGIDDVCLVGGDGGRLSRFGRTWIADDEPGSGPLGGVTTLARRNPGCVLVVCACDLVQLTDAEIGPLLHAVTGSPHDAVVAADIAATQDVSDDAASAVADIAPADVAVYEVDGVPQWSAVALSPLAAAVAVASFDAGERSLHRAFTDPTLRVRRLRPADPAAIADADRPEDLPAAVRGPARRRG